MNTAGIRILLVEDSPSDAELLQETLHQAGAGRFECTWVERLNDALARLYQESFDVLLLDLSLPDSSGPDTFRRAQKEAPGLPIVVLTSLNDERLGLAAVHEGVQDYLVKGQADGRQIARAIRYAIERKHAEEQLRQQREWLRVTLTSMGEAVIAGDTGGRITFLNPAAESLTGWKAEEALGLPIQRVFRIVNERTRQPADDIVARVLKENCVVTVANQIALLTKDGREVAIEDSAAPILDATGHAAGVVLVFHDVTEKRRAETALAAAHAEVVNEKNRLLAVMETLPVGVALVDALGANIQSNRAFEQVWGGPGPLPHSFDDYSAYKAWSVDTGQPVQPEEWASVRAVQKGETVVGQEMQIQRFDGTRAFVLNSAAPISDGSGKIAGGAVAIMDITARKQAEERIRYQNAVLEGINRILTEALTRDTDEELGRVCLAVAEEVTQSKFGFLAEINAEGRVDNVAISDPGWEACRIGTPGQRKAPAGFKIHGIYGRVLVDGKGFFTNDPRSHPDSIGVPEGHPPLTAFLGVPLKHGGKTIGLIAVGNREGGYRSQDLEALEALAFGVVQVLMRKRAERAARASEELLRQAQKMESIGLLAGGVAHDFNNLLTSIMGNASLLQDEVFEESRGQLDSILLATEKAADLTRQLLAYAGKGRLVVENLNLSRIVRDMTDLLRASIPKKVTLKLALKPDLPGVEEDRGQLQQIVMNLVINGAEAIGADQTGTVTITTGAQEVSETERISDEVTGRSLAPGSYVCIEVADTGCGMDNETRRKIFDPFFTTKFMGRGLGLAAVAGIIRAHSGAIQLDTAPGKGATFRAFLPAGAPPDAPRQSGRQPDLRGTETVLLVDDEAMVREVSRSALERYGYRVLVTNNGREAIRIFEEHAEEIGLVLVDLMMPEMGGDEAVSVLKSKCPGLRVIVMSGYSESEVLKMFAGKGVSGFLQKPFTATRLAEEVKAVLTNVAGNRPD
ncbi:MAG: response regulator [Bryobacteraceae bacterium]|jgi:PAS domain S-box-containing protein